MANSSTATDEREESATTSGGGEPTEATNGGENEVPFADLSREDQLGTMFRNIDEVGDHLQTKWNEERIQVYFLIYSFAMTGAMFYLLYQDLTWVLIGAFVVYIVTILPLLYMSEDDEFFQPDQASPPTGD